MLEAIDKMFQFNQNRHIDMFKDGISVPGELADVEFIQRGHPLVREEPFLFCTLVGFQVLTITKAGRKIRRKETSPVPVETAVGTIPTRTPRGRFQYGEI
jgi:hypothetical protein